MPISEATTRREPMYGSLRVEGRFATVTVAGEVDIATLPRFAALFQAALAAEPELVVVDLGRAEFLALCAVPVLERTASALADRNARLVVRDVSRSARRLFRAAEMSSDVEVEPEHSSAAVRRGLTVSAGLPLDRRILDAALTAVVTLAQAVVRGADGASITLPRYGRFVTAAATNSVVLEMDHDQYDTGQGPCLDAASAGERFFLDSLDEEERWPDFVPRARARGIAGIASTPLLERDVPIGALNIYSRTPGAFASHERGWADEFAAQAAQVVTAAGESSLPSGLQGDLLDALASRQTIAIATGMLLARDGGTAESAFVVLREASRRTNRPLREICEQMISSGGGSVARRDE